MKKLSKYIASVLALSVISGLFASCNEVDDYDYPVPQKTQETVSEDDLYVNAKEVICSMDYLGPISNHSVEICNEDYFVDIGIGINDGKTKTLISKYNYDGELISEIKVDEQLNNDKSWFVANEGYSFDGKDYFFVTGNDNENWLLQEIYVYQADYENGKLINPCKTAINDVFPQSENIISANQVKDNLIVLVSSGVDSQYSIFVQDLKSGNTKVEPVKLGKDSSEFFNISKILSDGNSLSDKVYYYVMRDDGDYIYSYNLLSGAFAQECSNNGPIELISSEGIVYSNRDGVITSTNINSSENSEILVDTSFSDEGFITGDVEALSKERFVIRGTDDSKTGIQNTKYFIVSKADKNPNAGKKIVEIACVYDIETNGIDKFISRYNKQNNEYYLKYTDKYSSGNFMNYDEDNFILSSLTTASDLLIKDIREGNGPDIVIGGAECSASNPKMIYVNIEDYLNDLNSDDYIDLVFNGFKTNKGTYSVPFAVSIEGISVQKNDNNPKGFTYSEYINFINTNHNGKDVIDYPSSMMGEAEPKSDMEYFELLYNYDCRSFMDGNKYNISSGENRQKFETISDYVKAREDNFHKESDTSISAKDFTTYSFQDYLNNVRTEERDVVGYPSFGGAGPYTTPMYTIQISKCASDYDVSWEIVKNILGYDFQCKNSDHIPVRLDALTKVCDDYIASISSSEMSFVFDWYSAGMNLDSVKNCFIDSVKLLSVSGYKDPSVMNILYEEMPAYFDGQKSLDEVITIVENRVNNMLSERG